jgi:hypothetical protein
MPDLTLESFYHCESAEHFSTEVEGSNGTKHTVSYTESNGNYQYDYKCTCHSFKFGRGKYCKHIKQVKESGQHCNWLQFVDGGKPIEKNGEMTCPRCGKSVSSQRWAV